MTDAPTESAATPRAAHGPALHERLRGSLSAIRHSVPPAAPAPFVVHLSRAATGRLRIAAIGPAGRAEAVTNLPVVEAVPRHVTAGDGRPWKLACRVGERLYAAVFSLPIAELLEASLEAAAGATLPIILVCEDDELASLPWELLRDGEHQRFLALSTRTPLSRAPVSSRKEANAEIERGNLRVTLLAESVEEDELALTHAIGADARVDLAVAHRLSSGAQPHVLLTRDRGAATALIPPGTPLVVVGGNGATAPLRPLGERAELVIPASMGSEARLTFAAKLAVALADGRPLGAAVANARRAVADEHSVVALDWAEPVLVAAEPSRPLVAPARSAAVAAGAEVAVKTAGWLRDALTGSISAVLFLIAGLIVYRLGFSTSDAIELDLLSPFELFSTFKGMILALSTYEDRILAIVAAALLVVSSVIGALWLLTRRIDPEEQPGLAARLAGPFTGLRAVSFLAMATLTIAGAFAYQQYLWRVVLPIPKDALGLAVTREAAAASPRDELADVLYAQGKAGRIVVRDLPISFDAGDTEKARKLGKRIGARAVLIYREIDRGAAGKQYAAYVVFTDPSAGLTIGGAAADAGQGNTVPGGTEMVEVREGVAVPALRTDTVAELVAVAAGVIAYDDNRIREAIALFEQARPEDPGAANYGVVNFYLGNALFLDDQLSEATTAYENVVRFFETRRAAAVPLTPQDELVLAKSYLQRGRIADAAGNDDEAIAWFDKALPLYDGLVSRAGTLDRPIEVRATFGRLLAQLADSYRRLDMTDDEQRWVDRAEAELDAMAGEAAPDDVAALAQEGATRFFIGDCVGSVAAFQRIFAIEPDNIDAANSIGVTAMFQGRLDLAVASWEQVLTLRPGDSIAIEQLAFAESQRGFVTGHYFEPSYLERGEARLRELLAVDPANANARYWIAAWAEVRAGFALLDATASEQGDALAVDKSANLWPADPDRRAAALAAWDVVIQERRIAATEILPGDPTAQADLASAYSRRQSVHYQVVITIITDPTVTVAGIQADGEALLSDAEEIRHWTGVILAPDSPADRLDRLRAWGLLIDSIAREWSWAVARGDMEAALALLEERRLVAADALAFAETAPMAGPDEASAFRTIYLEVALLAHFDSDLETYQAYQTRAYEIAAWELEQRQEGNRLTGTFCREERSRDAADQARAVGDLATARTQYETALAANPDHVASLAGLSFVLATQGEDEAAVDRATQATEITPDDPVGWIALVRARLGAGDVAGGTAALGSLVERTATLPSQERMSDVRDLILALQSLGEARPETVPAILTAIEPIRAALDAMPPEFARTYQYPALYAELGALALLDDDAATAEPLFRRSIEIDPHQPTVRADLVLAVIAQGRDATAEIDAAIAESRDPLWNWDPTDPTATRRRVLTFMSEQVDRYLARLPERARSVRPLADAIAAEQQQLSAPLQEEGS